MTLRGFTRGQIFILIAEMGIPVAALLFLLIINPSYEKGLLITELGRLMLAGAMIINFLGGILLLAFFAIINHFIPSENESTSLRFVFSGMALLIILALFTLTSLIVIIFGPAFIIMVEEQFGLF